MKSKMISILIIVSLLSCFFFMPNTTADTLQEQKEQNQAKQEEAEKELQYVEEELSEALVKIQELDDTIREAEKQIEEMSIKLAELETKVNETTTELEKVQKSYDENKKLMEDRLVVMYECGDVSYLDLLLRSASLIEFLSNYYMIEEIIKSDSELLEAIEKEKNEIETKKIQLEEEKAELKILKVKQEQTKIIMQNNKTVQQNEINKLTDAEKELQQKIQEYKDEEARIESLIQLAAGNYTYDGQYLGRSNGVAGS